MNSINTSKLSFLMSIPTSISCLQQNLSKPSSPKPKINYKDELVLYFFNKMLNLIVHKVELVESEPEDVSGSISADTVITSRPYIQVCNDSSFEELNEILLNEQELNKLSAIPSFDSLVSNSTVITINSKKKKRSKAKVKKLKSYKSVEKKIFSDKSARSTNLSAIIEPVLPVVANDTSWFIDFKKEYVNIVFQSGNRYEGFLYRKKFHGEGKFIWTDGTVYSGEFKNGEITGKGYLQFKDQSVYEGEFLCGYSHGVGMKSPSDCPSIYRGEWFVGQKHGQGWLLFEQGNWYDGSWKNGFMNGYGVRHYLNGDVYKGEWKMNKRHGLGCAIINNNDFYSGEWVEGKRNGYGEYTWNAFCNNSFCFPILNKYHGLWENDQMHGEGLMYFGSEGGSCYAGSFKQNDKHGSGVIICDNGVFIQSDPLFIDNKPAHFDNIGIIITNSAETLLDIDSSILSSHNENLTKSSLHDSNFSNTTRLALIHASSPLSSFVYKQSATFHFNTREFRFPSNGLEKETLANVNLCNINFPPKKPFRSSLYIPINKSSEQINLEPFLDKILEKYHLIYFTKLHSPKSANINKTWKYCNHRLNSCKILPNLNKIKVIEERYMRVFIRKHLSRLKKIYKQYACVACLKKLPFKVLLIRLFLWQMYRDCKIPQKGISLIDTDLLLAETCIFEKDDIHNPFQVIHFWQFINSLIQLAWKIYGDECMFDKNTGILRNAFSKFLEQDLFANVGQHIGNALFDYRDVLPFSATYVWYKSLGEPHSALDFLRNVYATNSSDPFSYQVTHSSKPDFSDIGINAVAIGDKLIFLTEEDKLEVHNIEPKPDKLNYLENKKLYFLRSLRPRKILNALKTVCPISINNDIINLTYQLSFLEFYETVLICTQKLLDANKKKCKVHTKRERKVEHEKQKILLSSFVEKSTVPISKSKKRKKKL